MTVGGEQGEIAEVGSPVMIAPDAIDGVAPMRWTGVTIGCAALLLACANAGTATDWVEGLPPGPVAEHLRGPVAGWAAFTARLGLDRPRAAMHRWWNGARGARFGTERPGQDGANDAP